MNIAIFLTKLLHISMAAIFIMFLGCFISKNLNSIYPSNPPNKKKKTGKIILYVIIFSALIYIFHYFVRKIMKFLNRYLFIYIIFWDDLIGYDPKRLKALSGGIAMAFSMFLFMTKFKYDLTTLFNERINIVIYDKEIKRV